MPESLELVSTEALHKVQTVVNGVLLPILLLFGVTGNVINMAVFSRQGLTERINICLFSLAISDCGFNLFHYAARIDALFHFFNSSLAEYWHSRGLMFIGVYHGFLNTSNMLILVISLERCICVITPLHAKRLLSARQTVVVVIAVFAVCLLGNGIGSFKYTPVEYLDPLTNATRYRTGLTAFYLENRSVFNAIFEITFNTAIPALTLLVVIAATVAIPVRMRSVVAWRNDAARTGVSNTSSSTSQREASVTRMLLVVCVVFTVCTTPSVIHSLVRNFVPEFVAGGPYHNIFFLTVTITHLLEVINCSVNVIVYYTMSTRYRETLKKMVCRACKREGRFALSKATVSTASSSVDLASGSAAFVVLT